MTRNRDLKREVGEQERTWLREHTEIAAVDVWIYGRTVVHVRVQIQVIIGGGGQID